MELTFTPCCTPYAVKDIQNSAKFCKKRNLYQTKKTYINQDIQAFEMKRKEIENMIKILFICHGNICRSTMAQFVFQDMVNREGISDSFYIDSAATSREEIGNPPHYGTVRKLNEVGVPVLNHQARQLTKNDYEKYDYFIGMDSANIRNMNRILGFDPEEKIHKLLDYTDRKGDIADPWYTGNFDVTYQDVLEGCEQFLKYLKEINSELM